MTSNKLLPAPLTPKASGEAGMVLQVDGSYMQWPLRVGIVGNAWEMGRQSLWNGVALVHHDLTQLLPRRCLS